VALVEAGTAQFQDGKQISLGNAIKPIEDNEDDLARAQAANRLSQIRANAPAVVQQLRSDIMNKSMSTSSMEEAATTIEALLRAVA
jgi:hypothetical protein